MKTVVACILGLALTLVAATAGSPQQTRPPEAILIDQARTLAMAGRAEEAIAAADADVAAAPHDFGAPVGRGEVLEQLGRRADAAASYRLALDRFKTWLAAATPEEAAPYLRFHALVLARLGRTPESIALIDDELERATDNGRLLALRCEVRVEANVELDRALADCDQALAAGHEGASVSRGLAFLRMEQWAEAERAFATLLQDHPTNPDALYGRGLARQHMGQAEAAIDDIRAARRELFYIDMEFNRRGLRQIPPPAN
jgi:tetratricopeptide (TPR) repeat protein